MSSVPTISVSSSQLAMPVMGMGTASYPLAPPEVTKAAIIEAIKTGYRHFDTCALYMSEPPLGAAITEALQSGLINSRDELFIASKLPCTSGFPHLVLPAIKSSLRNLQLDYLDLYLIHMPLWLSPEVHKTPVAKEEIGGMDIKQVWEAMEECKKLGLTKAIGVSNFSPKKLETLLSSAKIPPAVNQVEMSPLWQQKGLKEFCKAKGIHVTAYSPLGATGTKWGHNEIVESDILLQIAKAKGKSTAQIALRWVYEQGVSLVVKSFNKDRMKQNIDIFGWSLTEEELDKINKLPQHKAVTFASIYGPHDAVMEVDAEL